MKKTILFACFLAFSEGLFGQNPPPKDTAILLQKLWSSTDGCDTLDLKKGQKWEFTWAVGEAFIAPLDTVFDPNAWASLGLMQDWPELFSIPADKNAAQPSLGLTPNGDGKNDFFVPVLDILDRFPNNELFVFNRWGVLVFEAKPYDNSWNGRNFQDKPLPSATYYFVLRLGNANGSRLQGALTILNDD